MSKPTPIVVPKNAASEPGWLELVRQHVGSLRYGVVQIVVHDGHVTQIEKTERVRLEHHAGTVTRSDHSTASANILNA